MIEAMIFYLVFLDSIIANLMAWFDGKWYKKNFRLFSRCFPLTKCWTATYLVLVIWVGSLLWRMGLL